MANRIRVILAVVRLAGRQRGVRVSLRWTGMFIVAVTGVVLGLLLGGGARSPLGPFQAEFTLTPGLHGDTRVVVPPLGSLTLDSHAGPERLTIQLDTLDPGRTERLVSDPNGLADASKGALADAQVGIVRVVLYTTGTALLGSMILAMLLYRNVRRVAGVGGLALGVVVTSLGVSLATFRDNAIDEPRYDGLLVNAPAVVGDARTIASRYEQYRNELQRLVTNIGKLYTTVSNLPVYEPGADAIRVLHVSDMHLNPAAWDVVRTAVTQFGINVVVDTGDLVDWGTERESEAYAASVASLKVPYVFVRGNHDSDETAAQIARQPNAVVLDNQMRSVAGLDIAGIGDPRFTPDKTANEARLLERRQLFDAGAGLANTVARAGGADIALVHDPAMAVPLGGKVPLVLAGHTHSREVRQLDDTTLMMVQGSTGGAGLRGLQKQDPVPLALSVLYFTHDGKLQAYDDIAVGGTGRSEVTLQRRIVKGPEPQPEASSSPSG